MDRFSDLPSGPLFDLLSFLSFQKLIQCSRLNKSIFNLLYNDCHLLFKYHLNREFPSYKPFEKLDNLNCAKKLVSFYRRDFKWECLGPCESVQPRYLHKSAMTAEGGMIFFGGAGNDDTYFNDSWTMSFNANENCLTFRKFAASVSDPPRRGSCVICTHNGKAYGFGGRQSNGTFLNSVLSLSVDTGGWKEVYPSSQLALPGSEMTVFPPPRWGQTTVEWHGLLFLFGGSSYVGTFNDLWVLDLKALPGDDTSSDWRLHCGWRNINVSTEAATADANFQPQGRSGHVCLILEEHFMYLFGGNGVNQTFNDMWRIDLHAVAECYSRALTGAVVGGVLWESVAPADDSPHPEPQIGHSAVSLGSHRLLLYGGRNVYGGRMISGTMLFDARDNRWEALNNIKNHELVMNRTGHCALPTERGCLFLGGLREDEQYTAEIISLDLFTGTSCDSSRTRSHFREVINFFSNGFNIMDDEMDDVLSPPSIRVIRGLDI